MAPKKPKDVKKPMIKKTAKRKALPLTQSVSITANDEADSIPLSTPEQININQVFAQALVRYKNDSTMQDKQQKLKEISHLGNIAEEFLSCFTLIGFTMQGEKVCIFNAKTSKDEGALVDLLRSTFLEIANNRP